MSVRAIAHLVLHVAVPGVVARVGYPKTMWKVWAVLVATMVIDLDHLLAFPMYDPNRCSIGTHPLHTAPAVVGYAVLVAVPRARVVGLGLLLHIALDGVDCAWMRFAP